MLLVPLLQVIAAILATDMAHHFEMCSQLARRAAKWIANGRSPPDADGREYDPYVATAFPSTPLFRFGAGLSYTTFNYTALALSPAPAVSALPGGGTRVALSLEFQFKNRLPGLLATPLFREAGERMVAAFCQRAAQLRGRP